MITMRRWGALGNIPGSTQNMTGGMDEEPEWAEEITKTRIQTKTERLEEIDGAAGPYSIEG